MGAKAKKSIPESILNRASEDDEHEEVPIKTLDNNH